MTQRKGFNKKSLTRVDLKDLATKTDLKNLVTKNELGAALDERTNLIIEELSKDIRNGDERILLAIKDLKENLKPSLNFPSTKNVS